MRKVILYELILVQQTFLYSVCYGFQSARVALEKSALRRNFLQSFTLSKEVRLGNFSFSIRSLESSR